MEICHIIQPSRPPQSARNVSSNVDIDTDSTRSQGASGGDSGHSVIPSTHTFDDRNSQNDVGSKTNNFQGHSPGVMTPPAGALSSSGFSTPVFTDQLLQAHARETSWLIKLCLKNVLPYPDQHGDDMRFEPLPVRLESLQVLAHLTKGYFPIIR